MATFSITPTSQISSDNDAVTCQISIAAPRERVFEALTDPKQAIQWWGQNDSYHLSDFKLDARIGGKWSDSGSSEKMGTISMEGEILELDPPRRLSYTWLSNWLPKNTRVVWELETQNSGTLVKLTHTGFAGNAQHAQAHSEGWTPVLSWLQAYVEKGETVASRE